jgi:hypothetical protein
MRRTGARLGSEDHRMETKGRRIARFAGPGEPTATPIEPPDVPPEMPPQIPTDSVAETSAPAALAPLDAMAEPSAAAASASNVVEQSRAGAVPGAVALIDGLGDFGREPVVALAESRKALVHGLEALSDEVAGLVRCGIDTATRTAIEMLAVKTVSDAVALNAGFARSSFNNWFGSSARVSEIGAKLAAESSRLFLDRIGQGWIGQGWIGQGWIGAGRAGH